MSDQLLQGVAGEEMDKQTDQNKDRVKRQLVTAGIVIFSACCIILFYFCVERYQGLGEGWNKFVSVWEGIIIGAILAFLMNPIMKFLEKRTYPFFAKSCKSVEKAKKTTRMICSIISLLVIVGIIALILLFVIPELYDTVMFLVTHISDQIDGVLDWANMITGGRYEKNIMAAKGSDMDKAIDEGLKLLQEYINIGTKEMVSMVANSVIGIGRLFINSIIGMIVSIYILCSKETFKGQAKKLLYGIFKPQYANVIMEVYRKAGEIFYGFLIGKLIDSLIIGIICYVTMRLFGMPYPLLVSVIIGLTNIIPVFGPYIGAVPTVIIIFLTEPMLGIYFLIFVIILQQVDGNIIGPKILGNSTGLSSFWVVVAIVVGGGLFGFPGMLLGVPTMALIYYLVGRFSRYLLRKRNLPEDTKDYVNLQCINVESGELIEHPEGYDSQQYTSVFRKKKIAESQKKDTKEETNSD